MDVRYSVLNPSMESEGAIPYGHMTPPYDWIGMSGKVKDDNNSAGNDHPHPAINHQARIKPGLVVKNWLGFYLSIRGRATAKGEGGI